MSNDKEATIVGTVVSAFWAIAFPFCAIWFGRLLWGVVAKGSGAAIFVAVIFLGPMELVFIGLAVLAITLLVGHIRELRDHDER
jgi:hypothetical protein